MLVLFIRTTRGLDLTDEMQYYGQIKGLVETGKLFSNDLFIQQSVYILLYPAFYLYEFILGFDGFVFFGRLLLALLSSAVFLYAYRQLLALDFSPIVASLTALSLTFAIPYHGIFAPSYNTISQVLWIAFTLQFFAWKPRNALSLGALPIVMAFAHPTSAVTMSLLMIARLLAGREYRQAVKLVLVLLGGALIVAAVCLCFAAPQEYLASLSFSSGYGVGAIFFSNRSEPMTLLVIYAMFLAGLLFWNPLRGVRFAVPGSLLIAASIIYFSAGLAGGAYTPRIVYVLAFLSALAYAWSLSNSSESGMESRRRIHWLVVALLAYATTLGVTSGNGMVQTTGAFMVGLPLLLGIAASALPDREAPEAVPLVNIVCVSLVFVLFLAHWSRYPYREVAWLQAKAPIQSVPEFRFIGTSPERAEFVHHMQRELAGVTRDKRTLIVGEYPGFYFAFGARPETCMLYMHSLVSDKSETALLNCLGQKRPEIVVDIFSNNDIARNSPRIKTVMHNYYVQQGFACVDRSIAFNPTTERGADQLKYFVCAKRLASILLKTEKLLLV